MISEILPTISVQKYTVKSRSKSIMGSYLRILRNSTLRKALRRRSTQFTVVVSLCVYCLMVLPPRSLEDSTDTAEVLQDSIGLSYQQWTYDSNQLFKRTKARKSKYAGIKRGDMSWLSTPEDFFRRLEHEEAQSPCRRLAEMGGKSCNKVSDGGKMACFDPDVTIEPRHCTVYSFGVSIEVSFDVAADKYGCQVYMMDPTLPPDAYSWLSAFSKRMHFFPVGLAHVDKILALNLTNYADWQGMINVTILTYDNVKKYIGHDGPVQYLKMDIEGSEWGALEHMMDHDLLTGTRQIAVELHETRFTTLGEQEAVEHLRRRWQLLERLEDLGFLRVHYEPTPAWEAIHTIPGTNRTLQMCGELLLIRRNRGAAL